jgi:peroxiredoxin
MQSPSRTSPDPLDQASPAQKRSWLATLLWMTPAVFLILVVLYGVLTRQPADQQDQGPRIGRALADFTLPNLQGQPVRLADLRGKVIFINVWATWCQPCLEEMPAIQRLYDQLHERGLEVLAVSIDALGKQVVEPFVRKYQLTFPILLDAKGVTERLYRTTGVPESFIVDKRGMLVEKVVGPRDWVHPHLRTMFERLLATPQPAAGGSG